MTKIPEVIIVASREVDTKGNLVVTTTDSNHLKVGPKRAKLFDVFQVARAVKITWAEYRTPEGKVIDYISDAVLFDGKPPEAKQVEKITAGVEKTDAGVGQPSPIRKNPQNRSFALSYAKDVACASITQGKECSVEKTLDIARKFQSYLDE